MLPVLTVLALLALGEPASQTASCRKPFDVAVIRDGRNLSLDVSGSEALADLAASVRANPSTTVRVSPRFGAIGNAAVLFVVEALEREGVEADSFIITSLPRCRNCGLRPPEGFIPVHVDVDCAD